MVRQPLRRLRFQTPTNTESKYIKRTGIQKSKRGRCDEATNQWLLVLVGLDAADEEGLTGAERSHEQIQRLPELAA